MDRGPLLVSRQKVGNSQDWEFIRKYWPILSRDPALAKVLLKDTTICL